MTLASAIAQYRDVGWAPLGQFLPEEQVARLRARADQIMLEGSWELFFQHDSASGAYRDLVRRAGWVGPSLRYRKIEKLERDAEFRAALESPPYEQVARAVVGNEVALCRAVLFVKAAEGGTELPWHQDGGSFWGLSRDPELQIWLALDDAPPESGCLEVVPGSHLGGLATRLGGVIPAQLAAGAEALRLPARAGEAFLLHNHLWHRSGTNATPRPRRALTVCLMDASIRCTRKKRPRTFLRLFQTVPHAAAAGRTCDRRGATFEE